MFDSLFDELSSSFDEVLEECNLLIDKEFKGLSSQQKTKEKSFSDHALIFAPNSAPTPPSTSTLFTSSSSSSSSKILSCSSTLLPRLLAKASETEVISNGKQPATTPCSLCGRKFLPERLVSLIHIFVSLSVKLIYFISLFLSNTLISQNTLKFVRRRSKRNESPLTPSNKEKWMTMMFLPQVLRIITTT